MSPRAVVRLFDLLLVYDTDKPDKEIEAEALELIEKINAALIVRFKREAPQIEPSKTKIKIGVTPEPKEAPKKTDKK